MDSADRPAFARFLYGASVAAVVDAPERRNDLLVVRDDDYRNAVLARQSVEDACLAGCRLDIAKRAHTTSASCNAWNAGHILSGLSVLPLTHVKGGRASIWKLARGRRMDCNRGHASHGTQVMGKRGLRTPEST